LRSTSDTLLSREVRFTCCPARYISDHYQTTRLRHRYAVELFCLQPASNLNIAFTRCILGKLCPQHKG
jgi:hypothetical protein